MTDPTAEPSQRDQYREQIAEALWLFEQPRIPWAHVHPDSQDAHRCEADAVLTVRDAEMAQLRAEYDDLLSQRDMWWNSVAAERRRVTAQRDGLARRATGLRRERNTARNQFLDTYNAAGQQFGRVLELQAALYERTAQRNARDTEIERLNAELAGLRERAVEVQKYWRDWPSARRDKVRVLSQFLGDAIDDLATLVESWRAAPTDTPVSLGRGPDAPSLLATLPPDWAERMAQVERETQGEPATGWPCMCGTDETDMVHTAERCYSTTEPIAAPVSVIVDRATGERHEYPQQQWNPCFNAVDHHIHDEYHGNCCDRPSHWASSNGDTDA